MKNKGRLANALFFLSLLCVFVICSVLVVSYQIKGYHNIVRQNEASQNKQIAASYLRNRIRFYDESGSVEVKRIEQKDVLALKQGEAITYLYAYDGWLCELYAMKDYAFAFGDGEQITPLEDLKIAVVDDVLSIELSQDKQSMQLFIPIQSEGGIRL